MTRRVCYICYRPEPACYCGLLKPFSPAIDFVILIHPEERRRAIATGRMTHLCLKNSKLIEGLDFTNNSEVNAILADPTRRSFVLFPAKEALNISDLPEPARRALKEVPGKVLTLFVFDGTWQNARTMRRLSTNLAGLPALSITPQQPSSFLVRRQPRAGCLATIEAVHQVIELLDLAPGNRARPHDNLLYVFHNLNTFQLGAQGANQKPKRPRRRPS